MISSTPGPDQNEKDDRSEVGWLFVDLNSYFASVEQELRPELRGRPVGVVPALTDTTCCIAASYEAKAFGVRTGTMVHEARRLCPGIELIEARHELYVDYHHRVVEAVESCVPVTAVLSIDEMACRLMGRELAVDAAMALAKRIKQTIRSEVGSTLACSVGLAPNRYLAKVASDMQKPDGMVVLTRGDLPHALLPLSLRDLPGIGARMEKRLRECGIRTMEALLALSPELMKDIWGGIGGEKLWHWLRGEDFLDPELEHQKSISNSHVLAPEFRTEEGAWAVANKLLHKSGMRLRTAGLWTPTVGLTLQYVVPEAEATRRHLSGIPQKSWTATHRTVECQDSQTLLESLQTLWEQRPQGALYRKPFFTGVALMNLVPNGEHTLTLFRDEARRAKLSKTMDSLNLKYGTETLYFAGMHAAKAAAPTRIAFGSIPELF